MSKNCRKRSVSSIQLGHQKKRPAQLGTGRTFWQVGQESNLQPAVVEFTCLPINCDNGLQPVITFSPPHQARRLSTTNISRFPILAQLSADCRRAFSTSSPVLAIFVINSEHELLEREGKGNDIAQYEGTPIQRFVNIYERKPALRATAIRIHGTTCKGCG